MASHLQHKIGDRARVRLRSDAIGEDGEDFPGEVLVVSARSCDHTETICARCLEQWRWDWSIGVPDRMRAR